MLQYEMNAKVEEAIVIHDKRLLQKLGKVRDRKRFRCFLDETFNSMSKLNNVQQLLTFMILYHDKVIQIKRLQNQRSTDAPAVAGFPGGMDFGEKQTYYNVY